MPSKAYSFGTTEQTIKAEKDRTVLIIQNIHGTQDLYVSDDKGMALAEGMRISPNGSFDCKKAWGMEPEKAWHVVASGAATTARIYVDYGDYPKVEGITVTPAPTPPPDRVSI